MAKRYRIKLTPEDRRALEKIARSVDGAASKKAMKARALLLSDISRGGPTSTVDEIMVATGIKSTSLARLRRRVRDVGPLQALERKPYTSPSRVLLVNGEVEARLAELVASDPPGGRSHWPLRLLAAKLVELKVVDAISHETVRAALKKLNAKKG